jgi:hypothetical protein
LTTQRWLQFKAARGYRCAGIFIVKDADDRRATLACFDDQIGDYGSVFRVERCSWLIE